MSGVLVFVLGQIFVKFFIEPVNSLNKCIGKVADAMIFYANYYSNPGTGPLEKENEASDILRQLASQLRAKSYAVKWYPFFWFLRFIPRKNDVEKAATELIGLSNSIHNGDVHINNDRKHTIQNCLKFYF